MTRSDNLYTNTCIPICVCESIKCAPLDLDLMVINGVKDGSELEKKKRKTKSIIYTLYNYF